VLLEVMLQLLCCHIDVVRHFLVVRVVLLGEGEYVTQIVYGALDWQLLPLFCSLHYNHNADHL
jgi:hypothetical protein